MEVSPSRSDRPTKSSVSWVAHVSEMVRPWRYFWSWLFHPLSFSCDYRHWVNRLTGRNNVLILKPLFPLLFIIPRKVLLEDMITILSIPIPSTYSIKEYRRRRRRQYHQDLLTYWTQWYDLNRSVDIRWLLDLVLHLSLDDPFFGSKIFQIPAFLLLTGSPSKFSS